MAAAIGMRAESCAAAGFPRVDAAVYGILNEVDDDALARLGTPLKCIPALRRARSSFAAHGKV